jgi:hypothetical protein
MPVGKNLMQSAMDAGAQGVGSYAAIKLLNPSANNIAKTVFGSQMSVAQTMGINSFAMTMIDDFVIKDYVIPRIPAYARSYVKTGNFVGDMVIKGAAPVALMHLGGTRFDGLSDMAILAGEGLVGSYVGGYVYDKGLKPVTSRFI